MNPDPHADLRALVAAVCDETVTAGQLARLEHLIRTDPAAEAYFVQALGQHADLITHFAPPPAPAVPPPVPVAPVHSGSWSPRRVSGLVVALAALAAAVVVAVGLWPRTPDPVPTPFEDTDTGVAMLAQAVGAVWEDTGLPTRVGASLPPGRLSLTAGLAQVEFYSGATVVVEGPAELTLVSPMEAVCVRGKLRAVVPNEAHGFTVRTPKQDLVDRGTEFAVRVAENGTSELHVIDGKVEAFAPGAAAASGAGRAVTAGAGVRWDAAGPGRAIPADPPGFVSARDLAGRAATANRDRVDQWLVASGTLRADPSLVAYFAFDPDREWDRVLPDRGPHARAGAVVGATWVNGRWPRKRALEFKRVGDRVRFHAPGEFESLTYAAWVRVDGTERAFNSLVMTDDWDPGECHWQVRQSGAVVLGVSGARPHDYTTPPLFGPDRLGQWVHLAAVFDGPGRVVTHYLDGRPVATEPVKVPVKLRIGDAEVGNWNPSGRPDSRPVRGFNGRMDEVMIFARPLTPAAVRKLYEDGRPGG